MFVVRIVIFVWKDEKEAGVEVSHSHTHVLLLQEGEVEICSKGSRQIWDERVLRVHAEVERDEVVLGSFKPERHLRE